MEKIPKNNLEGNEKENIILKWMGEKKRNNTEKKSRRNKRRWRNVSERYIIQKCKKKKK